MRLIWGIVFFGVSSLAIFAQIGEEPIKLDYSANPAENNILLDAYPSSGLGSFAIPNKPTLLNPAFFAVIPQTQIAFDHQRFFWGIGDDIFGSSFVYAQHFINRGFGLSAGYFGSDKLATQTVSLHYGQRLTRAQTPWAETQRWGLFGGASAKIRRKGYIESNFRLRDPGDPLLSGNLTKFAFSFGVGLVYQGKNWRAFLAGDDLNMPNMALESGVEDRIPMEIQAGSEFSLPWEEIRAYPAISYRSQYRAFAKDIDPTIALRKSFIDGKLELAISGGRWSAGLGAVYYPMKNSGPGIGYEMSMPFSGIAVPTHRFSATYRFAPPPPAYPDLLVGEVKATGKPTVGSVIRLQAEIINAGIRDAKDVSVCFVCEGAVIGEAKVPVVPAKDRALVSLDWTPDKPGICEISARVDDTGEKYPEIDGRILELDETNNSGVCRTEIFGPPVPRLDIDIPILKVIQLITVTEDEPVVPIVFFDAGSDVVPSRFDDLLDLIAFRMSENPDATILVEGFYSEDDGVRSESERISLSRRRAENVVKEIDARNPSLSPRVRVSEDYDASRPRAVKEDFEGTRLGRKYTLQENRRAELRVYPHPPREWRIRNELKESDLDTMRRALAKNPMFELVAVAPSLDSAYSIEKYIAKELGPEFAERVYSRESAGEDVKLVLTAGAIIYNPKAFVVPSTDLKIEKGFGKSRFDAFAEGGGEIKFSNVEIKNDRGKLIWSAQDPDGLIKNAVWNWAGSDGKIVDPGSDYLADVIVRDELGQTARSLPETLRVVKTNQSDISERLILVQFTFAEAFGEADYASVRMEHLARQVVRRIENTGGTRVVVGGHTDIVGVESGNIKLSQRRADENLQILKRYMMRILSIDKTADFDRWLKAHNSAMSARGYGPERPYVISQKKGDRTQQIVIGDNTLPEGRIINRRVEIEFMPLRE